MDILPTCLDLAGVVHPAPKFRGREVVPTRGVPWTSFLSGNAEAIHATGQDITGWELFGMRAIRRGNWKAVFLPPPRGKGAWELYNVMRDPGEQDDLAGTEVEILKQLLSDWQVYIAETGAIEINLGDKKFKGV